MREIYNILRTIYLYFCLSKIKFLWIFFISIILSLLPLISLKITEKLGDQIAKVSDLKYILLLILIQTFIMVGIYIFTYLNSLVYNHLEYKYGFFLEKRLLEKISYTKASFLENPHLYNKISTISQAIPLIGVRIIIDVLDLAKGLISIIGIIVILKELHWLIIVTLITISLINIIMSNLFNKEHLGINVKFSEANRKKDLIYQILRTKESSLETRVFGISKFLMRKWERYFYITTYPEIRLKNKRELLVNSLMILTQILQLIIIIIYLTQNWPNISVGTFFMLTQAILQFQGYGEQIVQSLSSIHQSSIYLPIYYEILEYEEENINFKGEEKLLFNKLHNKILIKDLKFKYESSKGSVLNNINLEIKKGEKIAIVGHNGSGKTTLLKCLLGLYDDYQGNIYIDGVELRNYNLATIRKNIGWLAQDFISYPLTLKNNITLGNNKKSNNYLNNVIEKSLISNFRGKLPFDLQTVLNNNFSKGTQLSGGEWQKVGIARLIYKNPEILFLDEPTSAIDPISEKKLFRNLFEEDKTILILTHRLNICKSVDRIIVMHEGRIVEEGSHTDLISNNRFYTNMYNSQVEEGLLEVSNLY